MKVEDFRKEVGDNELCDAVLEANGGQPPDNFIPDAQGGGLGSADRANYDPAADERLTGELDAELAKLGAVSLAHS